MFRYRSQAIFVACLIAAVFCAPMRSGPRAHKGRTKPGIDILEDQNFAPLQGKRVGLITNQTGVDSRGRRTIDVLASAPGIKPAALFSPEHGIGANWNAPVADSTDPATGLRIYSLYGDVRRPTEAMLRNIDVLVFDIQDAGVRFYTYITTMAYCMETAKALGISFLVLDRPDPLGGDVIEGPTLDPGRTSFTGYFPMPVRYGMTMGELAKMFNAENHLGADLQVIKMEGWHRADAYDQTGLKWIPPSPNLRTVDAAFLYPGIEILQAGGVSVGRGTDSPFEFLGAPWIRKEAFAVALKRRKIPGVNFTPTRFAPSEDPYGGQVCEGVIINITDRGALGSMRLGVEIADVLNRLYPTHFNLSATVTLLGSQSTVGRLEHGDPPEAIVLSWTRDLDEFRAMREKYLLYQ
jgi:uncharacterized protein YbbC (DUF1343 family)